MMSNQNNDIVIQINYNYMVIKRYYDVILQYKTKKYIAY